MPEAATRSEKPSYLGLLNAISLAETEAGVYLRAWADATNDADLACVLRFVAARESSHGEVFRRRIEELGFCLRPKTDPRAAKRLSKFADPEISDLEKTPSIENEDSDPFGQILRDLAEDRFDPMTANLLNWYVTEEHDSARRLREAYACVRTRAARSSAAAPSADAEAIMACMSAGFARLEKSLEKLAKAVR